MRHLGYACLFLWWAAAGCVSSNQFECPGSDGLICADGSSCAQVTLVPGEDPLTLCVTPDQLDQCVDDSVQGKHCTVGPAAAPSDGTCHDHVCLPDACGNHLVDSMETCDDGNTKPGDGCSGDCNSNEVCGNALVDALAGEACDDGDSIGRDGCSAACDAEAPEWTLQAASRPSKRERYGIAFDARRHRTVVFGGGLPNNAGVFGDTFEWDGKHWAIVPTDVAPAPRSMTAMAYDPIRHVTVLFGGFNGAVLRDTWEWDGATWTQRTPTNAPVARAAHAMAYDAGRKKVILFGGFKQDTVTMNLQDTWEWDGVDWKPVTTAMSPPIRVSHALAYDPVRNVTVLFGGTGTVDLSDVWELGASGWTQAVPTGTGPVARQQHAMAFDRGEVLVIGGQSAALDRKDVWSWNGTRWRTLPDLPEVMHGISAAHDAPRGEVIVVSNGILAPGQALEFDGSSWTVPPTNSVLDIQPARRGHIAVAIPQRRQILIYGGDNSAAAMKTWIWDGDWHSITTPTPPGPPVAYAYAAAAYDSTIDRVVMFGGQGKTALLNATTFLWNPTTLAWAASPASGPSAREGAVMAYDPIRHQGVLFGGKNAGGSLLGDTWLWSSATQTWAPAAASGPLARTRAAMVFDPIAKKIVMFGGLLASAASDETWEWDGTSWTQAMTAIAPVARSDSGLAWDAARRRIVLFGGSAGGGSGTSTLIDDTWEAKRTATGLVWTQLDPFGKPDARHDHTVLPGLDGNGVLVIAGGNKDGTNMLSDVWRLQWDARTPYESCGDGDTDGDSLVGCADPDCWASCTPLCPPEAVSCDPGPRCGDNVCNSELESCYLCPLDCGDCDLVCGDLACNNGETHATCPGDCP